MSAGRELSMLGHNNLYRLQEGGEIEEIDFLFLSSFHRFRTCFCNQLKIQGSGNLIPGAK